MVFLFYMCIHLLMSFRKKGQWKIPPYGLLFIVSRLLIIHNEYAVTSKSHREKGTHQTATLYTDNTCKRFFVIVVNINPQLQSERYPAFAGMRGFVLSGRSSTSVK